MVRLPRIKDPRYLVLLITGASPSPGDEGSDGTVESAPTPPSSNELFIKSFIFQPDLPIRIDYEAKGFKTEMVSKKKQLHRKFFF